MNVCMYIYIYILDTGRRCQTQNLVVLHNAPFLLNCTNHQGLHTPLLSNRFGSLSFRVIKGNQKQDP